MTNDECLRSNNKETEVKGSRVQGWTYYIGSWMPNGPQETLSQEKKNKMYF